jgi:hypothetical protein
MQKLLLFGLGTFLVLTTLPAEAKIKTFISRGNVTLVELYTSEGCSSCPPADSWITKIRSNKDIYKTFIPIVFHVDYWNYLGWTDVFSHARYSARQRNYASQWKAKSVFTPSIVINGQKWAGWRNGQSIPNLNKDLKGKLKLYGQGNSWNIEVSEPNKLRKLTLNAVILGNNIRRKIGGGENKGKTLTHDNVVLDWQQHAIKAKTPSLKHTFNFAPVKGFETKSIVAWLQDSDSLQVYLVTGGDL